jgi:hypothetical protein
MLVILSIILLLIIPPGMYLIKKVKPGFTYPWLMGVFGALLAWLFTLASIPTSPETMQLITWEPSNLFSSSPAFLFDDTSWAFSISITALALAVFLTGILDIQISDIKSWSGTLLLAGAGLAVVNAGNLLTLIMAWSALDLILLFFLISSVNSSKARERIVFAFSVNAGGILILLWASATGSTPGAGLDFEQITQASTIFLVIAAGIRLAALPLLGTDREEINITKGLRTLIVLIPASASLILLARTALVVTPISPAPILIGIVSLSALLFSALWAAKISINGQPLFVLGMASLAAAAAIFGHQTALLAWSTALLLSGGLLFLYSQYHKYILPLILLPLYMISGLPFSGAWAGMELYSSHLTIFHLPLFFAQVLLLLGFIRRLFNQTPPEEEMERWSWVIYPLGLAVLTASHLVFHVRSMPETGTVSLPGWVGGAAAAGLAALLWRFQQRLPAFHNFIITASSDSLSTNWIANLLWNIYRTITELISRINRVLEGEGGVLWAFVLLAIIISIVSQRVLGG